MTDQIEKKQMNVTNTLNGAFFTTSMNSSSPFFPTENHKNKNEIQPKQNLSQFCKKIIANKCVYLHKTKCVIEHENINTAKSANDTINM